jgi:hypothetical protein
VAVVVVAVAVVAVLFAVATATAVPAVTAAIGLVCPRRTMGPAAPGTQRVERGLDGVDGAGP